MNKLFDTIRITKPKLNSFDLSHERKMSMNMGALVPMMVQEIVPGDKFRVSAEMLIRLAPMVAPVMHRVNVYTHFFFVPNRLLYANWEKFITGGSAGTLTPTFPRLFVNNSNKNYLYKGTLADYLGLPVVVSTDTVTQAKYFNALPFRAYQLIYNNYYRDQNLESEVALTTNDTVDGTEAEAITVLRNRCWEKDYFTSALPWAQRGAEVELPLGSLEYKDYSLVKNEAGTLTDGALSGAGGGNLQAGSTNVRIENLESTTLGSTTINTLRRAFKLQEWLEKNARGGSRYIEQIFSHFGVRSSDARLQRPEYLGGGKCPIVISEVLSNVKTTENPQGTMTGHGIGVGNTNSFEKFFEEHGFVIGIVSVLPRTAYQQGIERMWSRFDKLDYYFPEFAHLGEQEILSKELFWDYTNSDTDELTWGYQSRYAEMKYKQSSVHGDFRDNLATWHMGRIFSSRPELNSSFVHSDPTHRIFAVTDTSVNKVYIQLYNSVRALRPMPIFGTPML